MVSAINYLSSLFSGHADGLERNRGASAEASPPGKFSTVKKIAVVAALVLATAALIALGTYLVSTFAAKATVSTGIAGGSHIIPAPALIDGIWFYGRPIIS